MKWIENAPIGLFISFFIVLAFIVLVAHTLFTVTNTVLDGEHDFGIKNSDFNIFWVDFEVKALQIKKFKKDGILSKEEFNLFLSEFLSRYELTYVENGKKLFDNTYTRVDINRAKCYLSGYEYDQPFLVVSC
jgi:hypothetical protein